MTDREVFQATMRREHPERLLYYADFTPDLHRRLVARLGTSDIARYFNYDWAQHVGPKRRGEKPTFDLSRYYPEGSLPPGTTIDEAGVARAPGSLYHFWRYISPLREATSLAEIEAFPIEDVSDWATEHLSEEVGAIHAAGKVAVTWVGHMYETAWQIRGYEQFLMDLLERPAWAESLLNRLTANNLFRAVAAAKAGVDYIRIGDDVANQNTLMFSPQVWRHFMKSRWAQVCSAARNIKPDIQIWYHSDGNIEDIIPELIEIGVTILNPVQPECLDPEKVKKLYGSQLVIDGAIGTQTTMPWGSADEVRRVVRQRIETLGYDGGYIISPTHVLEPEVPIDNVLAFFEACREYGRK